MTSYHKLFLISTMNVYQFTFAGKLYSELVTIFWMIYSSVINRHVNWWGGYSLKNRSQILPILLLEAEY